MQEAIVIASIQRQLVDLEIGDGAAELGIGGIDERDLFGDGHGLRLLTGLQDQIDTNVLADLDDNAGTFDGAEAGGGGADGVGAGDDVARQVLARSVGG